MHANSSTQINKGVAIAVTAALGALLAAIVLNRSFYTDAELSAYFALTAFSVVLVHLSIRPLRDSTYVVALALLLLGAQYLVLHEPVRVIAVFTLLGLSSSLLLGLRCVWGKDEAERKLMLLAFVPSLLFVGSEYFASTMLAFTGKVHPKTFDLFLNWFDGTLGLQLSFIAGQISKLNTWLYQIAVLFYIGLPIPLGWVYARHLKKSGKKALPVMIAFLITGPIGIVLYNLLPACGPVHLFGDRFPWAPLPLAEIRGMRLVTVAINGPRNAIPSLHMTWVLLAWWMSAGLSRRSRAFVLICLLFTVFATLGTGEHYFVDLVVAFPFALMIVGISMFHVPVRDPRRAIPLLAGMLITLGWIGMLSVGPAFLWMSPAIPWALVLATVGGCIYLERQSRTSVDVDAPVVELELASAQQSGR